jgi:hypothetical protein
MHSKGNRTGFVYPLTPTLNPTNPRGTSVSVNKPIQKPIGEIMRVVKTGETGRVMQVDNEWAEIFPHKGPMIVLDVDSSRQSYSLCELDLPDRDLPPLSDRPAAFH